LNCAQPTHQPTTQHARHAGGAPPPPPPPPRPHNTHTHTTARAQRARPAPAPKAPRKPRAPSSEREDEEGEADVGSAWVGEALCMVWGISCAALCMVWGISCAALCMVWGISCATLSMVWGKQTDTGCGRQLPVQPACLCAFAPSFVPLSDAQPPLMNTCRSYFAGKRLGRELWEWRQRG
jgi:hypothetical protein